MWAPGPLSFSSGKASGVQSFLRIDTGDKAW